MSKEKAAPKTITVASEDHDDLEAGIASGAMIRLPKDFPLIDMSTGEQLGDEVLALILGRDVRKYRNISLNGYIPPLKNNIITGLVVGFSVVPSNYKNPQTDKYEREVVDIDGVAYVYQGDSAKFTQSKSDPDFDPAAWGLVSGSFRVGMMAFSDRLKEQQGKPVRIHYGPYVGGANKRKQATISAIPIDDPSWLAMQKALGL